MPVDVSVVICAFTEQRWEDLCAAVASVRQQTAPPLEIIVVIDYNAALLERARQQFSDVIVIENTQERGLSGGRNSGMAAAQGAIVACLDDDAIAAPDWLEWLSRGYADANLLGLGGSIEPLWWNGQRPAWFPDEFDWVVGCTYRGLPRTTAPVRNLIGANMSFWRKIGTGAGGFRTGFGQIGSSMLRCDDTEFCIRLGQTWPQRSFVYEPRAQVRHRVPASRASWRYFCNRCYTEGMAKALLAGLIGANDGLSSERSYALRTLPLGVLRNLGEVFTRRDGWGLARAAAIGAGLALTVAGYWVASVRLQLGAIRRGWFGQLKSAH